MMDDQFNNRNRQEPDVANAARDIARELRATSQLVREAALMGKDELLRYVSESMNTARERAAHFDPNSPRGAQSPYAPRYDAAASPSQSGGSYTPPLRRETRGAAYTARPRSAAARRYRPVSRGRWALFCVGVPLLAVSFICALTFFGLFLGGAGALLPLALVSASFFFPGIGLFGGYLGKTRREKRYTRYLSAVGTRPYADIRELAASFKRRYARVLDEIQDMTDRGYFGENARVDVARGLLLVDPAAAANAKTAQEEQEARQQAEAAQRAAQAKAAQEEQDRAAPDEYEAMLQQLRTLNERIDDDVMSERIYRIEAVTRATFLAVKEKPEKRPQIRRFMDYYLPTTIKLLDAYAGFEKQDVTGENIRKSKESIEKMTETMSAAFEKQFDSLFLTETMDINAEVRTMDSLLRQDGFVGGMTMPGQK